MRVGDRGECGYFRCFFTLRRDFPPSPEGDFELDPLRLGGKFCLGGSDVWWIDAPARVLGLLGFASALLLSTSFCGPEKPFNLSEPRFPHLDSVGDAVLVSQTVEII